MKRRDHDKVSLVEFLRSLRSMRSPAPACHNDYAAEFAGFSPRARTRKKANTEELSVVRSVN